MAQHFTIRKPFFEIGPKAFLYGEASLELALEAERLAKQYNVDIIYTPQAVDLRMVAQATERLLVFAQHVDILPVGPGIGSMLPEAVKATGAKGVLLNHAEKRVTLAHLDRAIQRCRDVGLATLVCADNLAQSKAIAMLEPDIILAEEPELIGSARSDINRDHVQIINEAISAINPNIAILHSAGISGPDDVRTMILAGADATGCTSAVVKAPDPLAALREMIVTLRETWDSRERR